VAFLNPGEDDPVDEPLLHLVTPDVWRAALAAGAVRPSVAPFVHLSTPAQVALPAERLYPGRDDLYLLVLDPARIPAEVRWEPGVPGDPAAMRFPHAYGPVPIPAVLAVVPYRPPFTEPAVPPADVAGRIIGFEASILRRAATTETPVTGGVAIRTAVAPDSHHHNELLVAGTTDADTLDAEADATLAGLGHRCASLLGEVHAPLAAELAGRGWLVEELVHMAAPAAGSPSGRVEQVDRAALRRLWEAAWRREIPGVPDAVVAQLSERYAAEEPVVDLRYLAVRDGGEVVAGALLKIDGATAALDAVGTDVAHRGLGHGDALVTDALALAAAAGCDLVGLAAAADDWPRDWYLRCGFTEVGRSWFTTKR
jgi:uncharacterized protein (DUF952 family)/ribosomal protein S18 acetylase RimI-like enzyme